MARSDAGELAEILDVIETDGRRVGDATVFDAAHRGEMQKRIKQHRGVAGG